MATINQRSRNVRAIDKAIFHNITGAGKSHVLRKFFGLSPADVEAIEQETDTRLAVNLNRDAGARSA
jgi:hypothetical protein